METLLFTPYIDDRYERAMIYSRIGLKQSAYVFDREFDFYSYVEEAKQSSPNLKCILVDEANFMTKAQVAALTNIASNFGIAVLCYGIRSDFLGEPFEGSKYLLTWADEIIEIKTICHCGRKATMNMRIDESGQAIESGEQVHIGGNESYLSVCMLHYRENVRTFRNYEHNVEAIV